MLRALESITGYELQAQDGTIGRCKDFLFDDTRWRIRYMVAATGKWLPGRKVLITPVALGRRTGTTRAAGAPDPRTDRQRAAPGPGRAGLPALGAGLVRPLRLSPLLGRPGHLGPGARTWTPADESAARIAEVADGDPHLRSCDEVAGYRVEATRRPIGHVEEFIVDDEEWSIRFLVVDTRNLLPGRKVLIAPEWLREVDWEHMVLRVELTREDAVRESPPFDPDAAVNREYETRLYDYYGRPVP